MVEVLANFPPELKNKVFGYQCHPVAELFKKEVLPGMKGCNRVMEDLKQYFPNLTPKDMRVYLDDWQKEPNMLLLYCALFRDEHKDTSQLVLNRWQAALADTSEKLDPHWFFDFLSTFFVQHESMWKNMTPSEFYEWVDEHCEFYFEDED